MIFRPGCPFVQRLKAKVFSQSRWFFPMDVITTTFFHTSRRLCPWSFLLTFVLLHDIVSFNKILHFVVVRLNSNDSKASSVIWTSPRLVSEPKKAYFIIWILKPGTDSIIPNRLIYLTVHCWTCAVTILKQLLNLKKGFLMHVDG